MYEHLLSFSSVCTQTEVCNIFAFCKNASKKCLKDCVQKNIFVEIAVNALEKYINLLLKLKMRMIFWFISVFFEQLKLIHINKAAVRYLSDLLTVEFLLKLTSTSLNKN